MVGRERRTAMNLDIETLLRKRSRRNRRFWRKLILPVTAGGATGASVMYLADPERGRRRRAIARDRATAAVRRSSRRAERLGRRTGATLYGMMVRIRRFPSQPEAAANDQMLTDRILSQAFRDRDIPHGRVNLNVQNGTAVLRGELDRPEQIREVEEAVEHTPGVRKVESYLHLPEVGPANKRPVAAAPGA
jgi:osmotically-inducible protein OsmY